MQHNEKNPKTPSYPTAKTDESTLNQTFGSFGSALDGRFQKKKASHPSLIKAVHPGLEQWQALFDQPSQ